MMNFQNVNRDEYNSSLYDGENLPECDLELSSETAEHMQNWSMIGAAMRNEKVNVVSKDFAASVMDTIKSENIVPDPVEVKEVAINNTHSVRDMFKKFAFGLSQMAIAASVAAVTIIGYQTYNAEGAATSEISATASVGSLGVANLASFQTKQANSNEIVLSDKKTHENAEKLRLSSAEAREQQMREVERINGYIKNYVFDVAAGK